MNRSLLILLLFIGCFGCKETEQIKNQSRAEGEWEKLPPPKPFIILPLSQADLEKDVIKVRVCCTDTGCQHVGIGMEVYNGHGWSEFILDITNPDSKGLLMHKVCGDTVTVRAKRKDLVKHLTFDADSISGQCRFFTQEVSPLVAARSNAFSFHR